MGLIVGVLFACVSLVGGMISPRDSNTAAFSAGVGVGAIVLFPIVYGVLGLVFGAFTAWAYNVFARMVGGIEVQLESTQGSPIS